MDTNKYRKKREKPYMEGALSDSEVQELLHTWNRPGERKCLKCSKIFSSEGAHNYKCSMCKQKEAMQADQTKIRDPLEHRVMHLHRQFHSFRSEIE